MAVTSHAAAKTPSASASSQTLARRLLGPKVRCQTPRPRPDSAEAQRSLFHSIFRRPHRHKSHRFGRPTDAPDRPGRFLAFDRAADRQAIHKDQRIPFHTARPFHGSLAQADRTEAPQSPTTAHPTRLGADWGLRQANDNSHHNRMRRARTDGHKTSQHSDEKFVPARSKASAAQADRSAPCGALSSDDCMHKAPVDCPKMPLYETA